MNNLKKEIDILLQKKKDKIKREELDIMIEAFNGALSKGVKINDEITISNFSELIEHLSFTFPESFKIENPEDIAQYIKIPEQKDFPKSFAISNAHDIAKYIKFPAQKEIPDEFRISNFPEIKTENVEFPDNVKKLSFKNSEIFLSQIYERIGAFAQSLKGGIFISNKKPSEAIPVRMVDEEGKRFKEMNVYVNGGTFDKSGLSTEETLQNVVTSVESTKLTVINSIDQTAFDLNAASFSATTNITNDYIFDSIELNFSTAEVKTITITSIDGTIIWGGTVDTSSANLGYNTTAKNFNIIFDQAFNGGENLTVVVTQTAGACLMDCILKTKQGGAGLTGNPILDSQSKTQIVGSDGTVWEPETNGAMPVNIQDQHTEIVDVYMCKSINTVTLASNTTIDTYDVTLTGGHGVVVGNLLCFKEGSHFLQAEVLTVITNNITLDRPLDFAFTTAASVDRSTREMNVDGSVTRQIFRVTPVGTTVKFDVTRIIFSIEDNSAMDTSTFGGIIGGITRGIVIRKKDGTYKNIFNAKTNDDFFHHCDLTEFIDKAPAGQYGFRAIRKFAGQNETGVTIRLDPESGDELQLIIQDNLTSLLGFEVIVQGHVVTD